MNIHQLSCAKIDGAVNGDFCAVAPLGDVRDRSPEAVTLGVVDGGHSSTKDLSTGRLCGVQWIAETQDQWRYSVCATSSDRVRSVMTSALRKTNRMLFDRGLHEEPVRDRSVSFAGGIIFRGVFVYTHLGNVRVLLYRDGEFMRLTEDHTLSRSLARRGLVRSPRDRHPYSELVNRRLGMGMEVPFRFRSLIMKPNDLLVLMTDGMGKLRGSSALNRMFKPLVTEWQSQGIPDDEIPLLISSHLRYHVSDALDQTRDDATLVSLVMTTKDLVQPVLPLDALRNEEMPRTPSLFDW